MLQGKSTSSQGCVSVICHAVGEHDRAHLGFIFMRLFSNLSARLGSSVCCVTFLVPVAPLCGRAPTFSAIFDGTQLGPGVPCPAFDLVGDAPQSARPSASRSGGPRVAAWSSADRGRGQSFASDSDAGESSAAISVHTSRLVFGDIGREYAAKKRCGVEGADNEFRGEHDNEPGIVPFARLREWTMAARRRGEQDCKTITCMCKGRGAQNASTLTRDA